MLNRLLAICFFSVYANHLVYWMILTGTLVDFPFLLKLFAPLSFAAPVCFYFYIKSFINDSTKLHRHEWLHFIPFVLALIDTLPWYFSSSIDWSATVKEITAHRQIFYTQKTGFIPSSYLNIIKPVYYLTYLFLSWRIAKASGIFRSFDWRNVGSRWISFLLTAATLSQTMILMIVMHAMLKEQSAPINPRIFLSLVLIHNLLLLSIILFIIYQPRILYSFIFVSERMSSVQVPTISIPMNDSSDLSEREQPQSFVPPAQIPKKSSVLTKREALYKEAMLAYMETQKPYLKPDFQISQLSQSLNIPAHHCSYVLNYLIGKNFRDWINSYRVNHFIQQYELKSETMTIEALASEAGFSNSATFYNAFKKEYIILPTDYFRQKKQRQEI